MKKIKLTYSLIGTLFISLAVSFFRLADFGTDPYTMFNLGFSGFLNMEFGVFIMISSLAALILIYFADRSMIGIGTLINIFLVGNLSDVTVSTYLNLFGTPDNLILRVVFSVLGILSLSMGAALYIEAKEGVAPYDALPIIVTDKLNGRVSFRVVRVVLDSAFALIGFLLGATLGVNTILTAFFLGPLIQFFRDVFQKDLNTKELKYATKK